MSRVFSLLMLLNFFSCAHANSCPYPSEWWKEVPASEAKSWEILPQAASCASGDVILSKRTELGIFSNYGATAFTYRGVNYASVEGFWQSLKYPENAQDPRLQNPDVHWTHTRAEVQAMVADDAKHAGDDANSNMKKLGITWVSFEGEHIEYKGAGQPRHYELIEAATRAKVQQNESVQALLKSTGSLVLKPDHIDSNAATLPSYRYYEILMKIRGELSAR